MGTLIQGLVMAVGVALGSLPQAAPEPGEGPVVALELLVEPSEIRAGMFFDGASFRVSALVPDGLGITVSCVGGKEPVVLNRKGRALGVIWMNVGEVEIDGSPDLYLLHASGDLGEMATSAFLAESGVGYAALKGQTTVTGAEGEEDRFFDEFVSLKESDGLYFISEEAMEVEPGMEGLVRMSTELRLPAKTPPGDYQILVHGFGREGGMLLGMTTLRVTQVGMAAFIRNLAIEHGLSYGIMAVVVAIAVGLFTGVVFGLGSKKAH
jgi:uncharacterized protein (TIGR02186 family)